MTRVVALGSLVLLACGGAPTTPKQAPQEDTSITQPVPANPLPPACAQGQDPPGATGDRIQVKVGEVVDEGLTGMTPATQSTAGVMGAKQLSDRLRFVGLRPGASDVYVTSQAGCIAFAFEVRP